MTEYPEIGDIYECFDDNKPFRPITLDCAIPSSDTEKEAWKLMAVVIYKTRYEYSDGKMVKLSFGLGDEIAVNAIIGLHIFKNGKLY